MEKIKAYMIGKNIVKFIYLDSNAIYESMKKYFSLPSSSIRYIGMFRFRCFHEDYVREVDFFSTITSKKFGDIPGTCIMILEDEDDCKEDYQYLTINPLVERYLIEHTFSYVDSNNKEQPVVVW